MSAESLGWRGGGQRLHPLSPAFEIGRSFFRIVVPGLIVLFLAAGDRSEAWYMLAFVPAVVHSVFRYVTFRYQLTTEHIVIREGFFFHRTRNIPYARIQNIDTVQNPFHRLFGLQEARLETAGGKEPEAVFRVLSTQRVQQIREGVFADRGPAAGEALRAPEERRAFFRMRPADVLYFGLLRQKGLALLGGLLLVLWEFDAFERIADWARLGSASLTGLLSSWVLAGIVLLLLFVLEVLAVVWAFVTLYDFHVARRKDDLQTACGLWTRQSATLPRYRIQFLSIREGWLQRRLGRISIKVLTAGGDSTSESQVSRKWLVPLAGKRELGAILAEVQPGLSFDGVQWHPVHPNARRRMFVKWMLLFSILVAVLVRNLGWWALTSGVAFAALALVLASVRARRLGCAVDRYGALMRDGVVTRVQNAVRFSTIQSVSLTQTPLDRRHGMATLRVDTAGAADSELSFSVPYLPLRTARGLMDRMVQEASTLAFRW